METPINGRTDTRNENGSAESVGLMVENSLDLLATIANGDTSSQGGTWVSIVMYFCKRS